MCAEAAGLQGGPQAPVQGVVTTLGGGAGVGRGVDDGLVGVGQVVAGTHSSGDGLEVGASFRGEIAGDTAHPVGALLVDGQAAAVLAVGVIEDAIGVVDIGQCVADLGDECRVLRAGMADQLAFGSGVIGRGDSVGQGVEGLADLLEVGLTEGAVVDGRGDLGEFGRTGRSGEGAPRPDAGGQFHPAGDLPGRDAQASAQEVFHGDVGRQAGVVRAVGWVGDLAEDAVHQAEVGAGLGFQAFGDVDAEGVAHQVGGHRSQHGVGGVDGGECVDHLPACCRRIHAHHAIRTGVRQPAATGYLWMKVELCITQGRRYVRRSSFMRPRCSDSTPRACIDSVTIKT